MDLPKFCALLASRELWFATAEALAVDDPHEGLLPLQNYSHRNWNDPSSVSGEDLARIQQASYGPHDADLSYKIARERWNREHNLRCMFIYRRSFFINCWHAVDHESVAMWRIYGSPGVGIAIPTTAAKLKFALNAISEDMYFGRVRYITDNDPPIDTKNAFNAALIKRAAFTYEQEVRLIYSSGSWGDMPPVKWDPVTGHFTESPLLDAYEKRPQPSGRSFPIDLEALTNEVWVSPFAPQWLDGVIKSLCKNFGVSADVRRSNLLVPPPR